MKIFFIILMTGIALSNNSMAQVWGIPTRINNSFAGSAGNLRISSLTTFDQDNIKSNNTTKYLSRQIQQALGGDYFIKGISTGIGLITGFNYFRTNETGEFARGYQTQLIVAPKISFKGKYTLSPSFSLTKGCFYSKFHRYPEPYYAYYQTRKSYSDYSASILFNTNKFYLGYQFNLYPSLNTGEYYSGSNIQTGFTLLNNEKSEKSLTIQAGYNYSHQHKISRLDLHFTGRKKWLVAGIGLNKTLSSGNGPDLDIMAGLQLKKIRILYIQNNLAGGFGSEFYQFNYSGSLSIRSIFGKENTNQKITN